MVSKYFFFGIFTPNIGEDEPILAHIFSKGLVQPPTRWKIHMEPKVTQLKRKNIFPNHQFQVLSYLQGYICCIICRGLYYCIWLYRDYTKSLEGSRHEPISIMECHKGFWSHSLPGAHFLLNHIMRERGRTNTSHFFVKLLEFEGPPAFLF